MQLVQQDVAVTAAKGERQASSVASLPAGSRLSRYPAGVAAFRFGSLYEEATKFIGTMVSGF